MFRRWRDQINDCLFPNGKRQNPAYSSSVPYFFLAIVQMCRDNKKDDKLLQFNVIITVQSLYYESIKV